MDAQHEQHQLLAIMITDIVGYSALSSADEGRALVLLEEHRTLVRARIAGHGGREIKTLGDGFLVSFASAVEAVGCAVNIQEDFVGRNRSPQAAQALHLRIGLHLGEVVLRENDIYGNGVNIAARLEPIAVPDGVCLSDDVARAVEGSVGYPFVDGGERHLKNIPRPVRVYGVGFPWLAGAAAVAAPRAGAGAGLWVAVLPFHDIGGKDPDLAEGLTDELIALLSRLKELRVIARSSAARFAGPETDTRRAAAELDVGTLVEGSLRIVGERCRISVRAVAADSQQAIWAEQYDRGHADVLSLQSEIAYRVATALRLELSRTAAGQMRESGTVHPEAFREYLKGRKLLEERTAGALERAAACFQRALALDAGYVRAHDALAETCSIQAVGFAHEDRHPLVERARAHARQALELDPADAEAHAVLAYLSFRFDFDWAAAERSFHTALGLNPSHARVYESYALFLAVLGRGEEAVAQMQAARELDPLSTSLEAGLGRILYFAGRIEEALVLLERTLERNPVYAEGHFSLGIAYAASGRSEDAVKTLRRAAALSGGRPVVQTVLALCLSQAGRQVEADEIALQVIEESRRTYVNEMVVAEAWWAMQREPEMIDAMHRAFASRDPFLIYLLAERKFLPSFHRHPEVQAMMREAWPELKLSHTGGDSPS